MDAPSPQGRILKQDMLQHLRVLSEKTKKFQIILYTFNLCSVKLLLLKNSNYIKKYYSYKRKERKKCYTVRSILDLESGKGIVRSVLNREMITKCSIWQKHSKCSDYMPWNHNLWDI
jgi:hypothetical protein